MITRKVLFLKGPHTFLPHSQWCDCYGERLWTQDANTCGRLSETQYIDSTKRECAGE